MADDGRAKRLKSSEDDVSIDQRSTRIAELQRDPEMPADLDAAVDLTRVDASIVTHISSFVGTSRELLGLALTCKTFGWRQPTSTLDWSLAEESARQVVRSRATDGEVDSLPRYASGLTTWLSILHAFELPLMFDVLLGGDVEYRDEDGYYEFEPGEEDKTTVYGALDIYASTAVASGYVMRSGSHFTEFDITGESSIGIVRPMAGLDAGRDAVPTEVSFTFS